MDSWDVLDHYFQDHAYPFTQHHLNSFREFLKTHIPATVASYNPITMIKTNDDGSERLRVEVFVGTAGLPNTSAAETGLYLDRPTLQGPDGAAILLTPQESRLRHLTYQTNLSADITVRFTHEDRTQTIKQFPRTLIASLPIMVHSDPCVLHGQGTAALRELGECPYDHGGYFIIDGKEKVIISQERLTTNRLFVAKLADDQNYSYSAAIRCTGESGETALIPRTVNFYLVKTPDPLTSPKEMATRIEATALNEAPAGTNPEEAMATALLAAQKVTEEHRRLKGAILVSLPAIKGKIPLFTLFRALGVESDKAILEHIVGPLDDPRTPVPEEFLQFLRPSMVTPHYTGAASAAAAAAGAGAPGFTGPVFTQRAALEYLRNRVFYESTYHVKTLLVSEVFPNVTGSFANKARFLGYLVSELMRTALGIQPPSDRDSYLFKRVDISGFLLAQLFQETYNRFRKNCRNMLDHDYNYGPWKNTGVLDDLVNPHNLHKLFNAVLISETFQKSLKGLWGPPTDDPEQGLVQDLARISYIGFLSHLRRVNLPLDRSIKVTSPHRLHAQQWGIMCPFESPDGASIGYLKNFALLTHITFGTDPAPIRECLRDLGVVPLAQVTASRAALATSHGDADATLVRVFINGDWFGVTATPDLLCDRFRVFRRNGIVNPFVSISWDIKLHTIRVLTEPGRPCRPLFIGTPTASAAALKRVTTHTSAPRAAAPPASAGVGPDWFDLLFGTHLDRSQRNEARYYKGDYTTPDAPMPFTDAFFAELRTTQGVLEFLDIEEANTMLLAIAPEDGVPIPTDAPNPRATHTEIHPVTLFSVVTNNIPLANCNFAPRNTFFGAQSKQAIGIYSTNFHRRFDTVGYLQHYPQKPLVTTRGAHYVGNDRMPNGFNCIVAVATYTGFNQEDGIIINRTAIDRGLFQITKYKTLSASEKIVSDHDKLVFANPVALRDAGKSVGSIKRANYTLLNDGGFLSEGSYVPRGQQAAVIGMVHIRDTLTEEREGVLAEQIVRTTYTDASKMTDVQHYGTVDRVFVGTRGLGADTQRVCKVRFRKVRRPELGDKSCCYDSATEVLTTRGWIFWASLREDDQVATLRRSDGALEYVAPLRIYNYDYTGKMYTLETPEINLCVTPNHRLFVERAGPANAATDISPWSTTPMSSLPSESESLCPTANAEFIEARDTEGTTLIHRKNALTTLFTDRAPNAAAFQDLANIHWRSSLADGLPEWVWHLTITEADALLHEMSAISILGQPDSIMTSYKSLADDLQRLALHAGHSATIWTSVSNASSLYTVAIHRGDAENTVVVSHDALTESGSLRWTDYAGKVYCCETPETHGTVYVRRNGRAVWCGNSRYAQKGVFGMVLPAEAMPFSKDGVIPDLIINPHAFPSRMTIAHLVECVFAKVCAIQGQVGDGTVFMPFDKEAIYDSLAASKFERHGNEILYNGRTGEQIQTEIFMGPTYYLRLKHMVADKVHARPTGPRDQLTRQPTSGRSLNGGLRIGEMERDVLLSHGISQFTKETLLDRSDKYAWTVCRNCGTMTANTPRAAVSLSPAPCGSCGNSDPVIVQTPYAFKLLVQELEAMGIQARLSDTSLPGALPFADDDVTESDDDDTAALSGGGGLRGVTLGLSNSIPVLDIASEEEAEEPEEEPDEDDLAEQCELGDEAACQDAEDEGAVDADADADDDEPEIYDDEPETAADENEDDNAAAVPQNNVEESLQGGAPKKSRTGGAHRLAPPPEIVLKLSDADAQSPASSASSVLPAVDFLGGIGRLGAGVEADDAADDANVRKVINIQKRSPYSSDEASASPATGRRGGSNDDENDGEDDDFFN